MTIATNTIVTKGRRSNRGGDKDRKKAKGRGNEQEDRARFSPELLRKLDNATEGFTDHFVRLLKKQVLESNIETICDYILAINTESDPSVNHKRNQLQILCYLSEFLG